MLLFCSTLRFPPELLRFVRVHYLQNLGMAWVVTFGAAVFCVVNYQPGVNAMWNPQTSNIALIFLLGYLFGMAGLIYGFFRGLIILRQSNFLTQLTFLALALALPSAVHFVSAKLIGMVYQYV
jgi:hypothetical protein